MVNSRLLQIKAIFAEAMEKDAADRPAFIAEACGGDAELQAEVEEFLSAAAQAGDFLNSPTHDSAAPGGSVSEPLGTKIGPYKLLELVGEGGFGSVFMAEQEAPVRRKVALKIIKLGMDTKQVIARFEAERQALAIMEHPNIAKVFDAGSTETGRPYFVMELVRGIPITEYCDQYRLPLGQRIELFVEVCQAIQHAHQKGIIHRDIKPSNVLVTVQDGKGVPKIIDFGIAKAIDQRLTEKTLFTEFRHFVGTPAYMSPEQAQMSDVDVDTRSDIYSLGVLLYELLTGTTPFDTKQLLSAGLAEMQRIIIEVAPPRPSTRLSGMQGEALSTVTKMRRSDLRELSTELRGDPDWIIMCCLEKDRARRYATAGDLAADAKRYLENEPIHARPPSRFYLLRKFVHRNRTVVAGVGAILLALGVFAGMYIRGMGMAQQRTMEALVMARDSQRAAERDSTVARHAAAISNARYLIEENQLPAALISATSASQLGGDWEDGLVLNEIYRHARDNWQLDGHIALAGRLCAGAFCWSNNQDYLIVSTSAGLICFDPHTCRQISATSEGAWANRLIFPQRADSGCFVATSGTTASVFELPSLRKLAGRDFSSPIHAGEANASELILIHGDGTCRITNLKTLEDHAVTDWLKVGGEQTNALPSAATISPEGRVIIHGGSWTRPQLLWDRTSQTGGQKFKWLSQVRGNAFEFVDDHRLAVKFSKSPQAIEDDAFYVIDVDSGKTLFNGSIPSSNIKGTDYFEVWPANDYVGVGFAGELGCGMRYVPSDDMATFRYTSIWPFADDPPRSVAISAYRGLLALSSGSTIRTFDQLSWINNSVGNVEDFCTACCGSGMFSIPSGDEPTLKFEPYDAVGATRLFKPQWLAGGRWHPWAVATSQDASTVVIVAEELGQGEFPTMGANYGPLRALVYRPGEPGKAASVWPIVAQFPLIAPPSKSPWMRRVAAVTPDGKTLLYGAQSNAMVRYSIPGGEVLSQKLLAFPLARSADETLVAGAEEGGQVRVIDVASGSERGVGPKYGSIKGINFSTDNSQLIVSGDGRIDRFNLSDGKAAGSLRTELVSMAWPAAGTGDRFLAYRPDSIGSGGSVVMADTADGHDVFTLDLASDITCPDAFFSPSGRELGCRLDRWHARVFRDFSPKTLEAALRYEVAAQGNAPTTLPAIEASPAQVASAPSSSASQGVLDAGDGQTLAEHLSQEIEAEGIVQEVSWTYAHNAANLVLASKGEAKLLIWISARNLAEFQHAFGTDFDQRLVGKRVRIRGIVGRYLGRKSDWSDYLEIPLDHANQLQVLDSGGTSPSATAPGN